MARKVKILIVEDDPIDFELCGRELRKAGYEPECRRVDTRPGFLEALQRDRWDLVLCDYQLPQFDAMEALELLRENSGDIPFLVVTGSMSEETAVDCLKRGADNYILKENLGRLGPAVDQALKMLEDRRERRRLEEQLRQTQRMEAVGQLAAGIAHDFNNILTAIIGNTQLLLDGVRQDGEEDDPLLSSLTQIERAGQRASTLTRQLLTFSRQQVTRMEVLEPSGIVADMEKMLRRLVSEDIEIEMDLGGAVPPVQADAGQLEQIVMNLVVNASDAMLDGGKLSIRTGSTAVPDEEARTHEVEAGDYAFFEVGDTGTGIDADTLAHMFEPFFTTKPVGKGTGLGLATVHGVARQLGGFVTVQSELGKGTVFRVLIPASAAPFERSGAAGRGEAPTGNETILVCEDDAIVRSVTSKALERYGYQVLIADGPGRALSLAQAHPGTIHLLVTDVIMPRMNGRALAEELRSIHPETRVLFVSGYPADAIGRRGVINPEVEFLPKPFTIRALLQRVREVLDMHGVTTP